MGMDWFTFLTAGFWAAVAGIAALALRREPIFRDISRIVDRVLTWLLCAGLGAIAAGVALTSSAKSSSALTNFSPDMKIKVMDFISETIDLVPKALFFLGGVKFVLGLLTLLYDKQAEYKAPPGANGNGQ